MSKYIIFILIILIILIIYYYYYNNNNNTDMWFNKSNFKFNDSIILSDLHGYVLPHASTKYTGNIISHTLRFKPKKKFNKVIILYYPSHIKPNVKGEFHEYYVVHKSLDYIIKNYWKIKKKINYIGYNTRDEFKLPKISLDNTLIVVSADFSHFLQFKKSINLENKAAHALVHRKTNKTVYNNIVDHIKSFKVLYEIINSNLQLQWIGRTRSPGYNKAVGYLSFLIREIPSINEIHNCHGMFVTAYDKNMNARECLGEWFDNSNWTKKIENNLIKKVLYYAMTTSRLTNGSFLNIPIKYYTIYYLYKVENNKFIRGWHGIKMDSFFLSDVFLENTFDNGSWITNQNEWPTIHKSNKFNLNNTFNQLQQKSGIINENSNSNYKLYSTRVHHIKIKD